MSAQIGIPKYKDVLSVEHLDNIKRYITNIALNYNKLANEENSKKRDSDDVDVYLKQFNEDINTINSLTIYTQKLYKELIDSLFTISSRTTKLK